MSVKNEIRMMVIKIIFFILGFLAAVFNIAGYYPLIPGWYCATIKDMKKGRIFSITGLLLGAGFFMPSGRMLKYILLIMMIHISIGAYSMINKRARRVVAGAIIFVLTLTINIIRYRWIFYDTRYLIYGISEALIAFGIYIFMSKFVSMAFLLIEREAEYEKPIVPQDKRVVCLVTALGGLSTAFKGIGGSRFFDEYEQEDNLKSEVTGILCATCDGCEVCWNKNQAILSGEINSMIKAVIRHEKKDTIIDNSYVQRCKKYPKMVEEAINAFGRMEVNKAWYKRLLDNRTVIAQQLDAMTKVLENWSYDRQNIDITKQFARAKIKREALECGIYVSEIHFYKTKEERIIITSWIKSENGGVPVKEFLRCCEKITGLRLRLQKECKGILAQEMTEVTIYEDVKYYVLTGFSGQKKNTSMVSGDNFSMFDTDEGAYHICLSDGMGSGVRAYQESELVVDLMEKFIEAGFETDTAVKLMNSAMVLKGESDSFSTLDLSSIDLYNGKLTMIKIGAAATFIKRKDEVTIVESESLPAGVDIEQDIEKITKNLKNGDFLVMVTDGVIEYLNVRNPQERLGAIISDITTDNAGVLSQKVLDKVLLDTGGYVMDDMTVLAIGIWEK